MTIGNLFAGTYIKPLGIEFNVADIEADILKLVTESYCKRLAMLYAMLQSLWHINTFVNLLALLYSLLPIFTKSLPTRYKHKHLNTNIDNSDKLSVFIIPKQLNTRYV